MKFNEKYNSEKTWQGKCLVIGLYHMTMKFKVKEWTLGDTADYFDVSIGLISENINLAKAINEHPEIYNKIESRKDALKKLNGV